MKTKAQIKKYLSTLRIDESILQDLERFLELDSPDYGIKVVTDDDYYFFSNLTQFQAEDLCYKSLGIKLILTLLSKSGKKPMKTSQKFILPGGAEVTVVGENGYNPYKLPEPLPKSLEKWILKLLLSRSNS